MDASRRPDRGVSSRTAELPNDPAAFLDTEDGGGATSLRFAIAAAARHDRLLVYTGHGNQAQLRPWPPPSSPHPFAVFLAADGRFRTVALDFDTRTGNAGADAAYAGAMLREVGVRYVETVSGPSGGRHIFLPLEEGLSAMDARRLATSMTERCPSLDVTPLMNPATGAIRPPLAPHRLGGRSEVIGDIDVALDVFARSNGPMVIADLLDLILGSFSANITHGYLATTGTALPTRMLPLSRRIRSLSIHGDRERRYASASEARRAVARALAARGYSGGQFKALMRVSPVGLHNGRPASDAYLQAEWKRAIAAAEAEASAPESLAATLRRARLWASSAFWPGRIEKRQRDLRAYLAMVDIAEEAGKLQPLIVSARMLAVRLRVDHVTASRALRSLQTRGLITRCTPGAACGRAATYGLLNPPSSETP